MRIAIACNSMPDSLERIIIEERSQGMISQKPEGFQKTEPGGYKIAWITRQGDDAVRKCASDRPDLILMDLDLPVLDGVEATRRIMRQSPCPILILASDLNENTAKIFQAFGCGAVDAVNLPKIGRSASAQFGRAALLRKIKTIALLQGSSSQYCCTSGRSSFTAKSDAKHVASLTVIGSSTGGPKTLVPILAAIPSTYLSAIVIIQHLEKAFSGDLAHWLDAQVPMPVKLAENGDKPRAGVIYIAGTDDHLTLTHDLSFIYTPHPRHTPFRPSVDVFFKRVAASWPHKGTGILLTGMGRDGAQGLAALRRAGWHTIAQDKHTSIVYGMPRAAKELGAASEILPAEKITSALLKRRCR